MVTESGDLVVLAVHRKGEDLGPKEVTLAAGDVMLVKGAWEDLAVNLEDPDVLVVDEPRVVRRQAVPLGPGAKRTLAIVAVMVVLLATGAVPAAVAGLLAAGALILTRVLSIEHAYRGISWTTIVLVAGMIPLSTAMQASGAADEVADRLLDVVGGPYTLLIGLFVVIAVLGQLISNTATSLIVIPVAIAAATELDVSVRPVLMFVTVISSAALLTPVATPANLMVMGPGGYRFGDYAKLGLPLLAWYFVVGVGLVPVFWGF
jgi:di/tricarboxylate transporter